MARKTFNEFCQIEVVELAKLAVEMQATNIELVNEFAILHAKNKRLKETGWYLYQQLADYGQLSKPETEKFTPDQDFKNNVLAVWEQAVKDK